MSEPLTVPSWGAALGVLRELGPGTTVRVSKADEPELPAIPLRRSNVPWSVHKGAIAVYREDTAGEHVQLREYDDHWTLELDRHNPRYRPARHVAVDTRDYRKGALSHPLRTLTGATLYTPVRSIQFAEEMATLAVETPLSILDRGLETARKGLSMDS
ncbi:hypothetical protein [Halorarius litoreus]|uniref:hypothetical protein n=1 Tax=Halorarius litoreus TaxID=2962676 RepID=UPI0020CF4498|nr:hypothetical protein [Halorarius litoreus]